LSKHLKQGHPDQVKSCPYCGDFATLDLVFMKKHLSAVHQKKVTLIKCSYCPKTALSNNDLLQHNKIGHKEAMCKLVL
jgi:hypothetical protein